MIRLATHVPSWEDGTSFYRGAGPLAELLRDYSDELTLAQGAEPHTFARVKMCDAVFMQRPFVPQHVQIASEFKANKIPLWIDYDDDLFCVPNDNFTHDIYNNPQMQESVKRISSMANIISVSTEHLKKKMKQYNDNVIVVPNAIDTRLFQAMPGNIGRSRTVMWRGSHTHVEDLRQHTDAILSAFKEFPEWNWFFAGFNPYWITNQMTSTRCLYQPFVNDQRQFIESLIGRRAAIHIVPLNNNDFNHSKSNIAHLEASIAGSAILGPNWDSWQDGDIFRYNTPQEFHDILFKMLRTPLPELAEKNNNDWAWIQENRSLKKSNETRMQIIRDLVKK